MSLPKVKVFDIDQVTCGKFPECDIVDAGWVKNTGFCRFHAPLDAFRCLDCGTIVKDEDQYCAACEASRGADHG